MSLPRIRHCVLNDRYEFSSHALEEMDEDALEEADVRWVLLNGRISRRLSDDPRGMRFVVRARLATRNEVEVVCRILPSGNLRIITVYVVE